MLLSFFARNFIPIMKPIGLFQKEDIMKESTRMKLLTMLSVLSTVILMILNIRNIINGERSEAREKELHEKRIKSLDLDDKIQMIRLEREKKRELEEYKIGRQYCSLCKNRDKEVYSKECSECLKSGNKLNGFVYYKDL